MGLSPFWLGLLPLWLGLLPLWLGLLPPWLGLLPPWYDVDTPAEAGWLKVHLQAIVRAGGGMGRHSLEVMRDMALPLPS